MIEATWTQRIETFLSARTAPTTVSEIAREALGIGYDERLGVDLRPVTRVLKRLGWRRSQPAPTFVERWSLPGSLERRVAA
jgi:hypothetical protein